MIRCPCSRHTLFVTVVILLLALVACSQPATTTGPDLAVEGAWARTANEGTTGAVYFTLHNTGAAADRLVDARTNVAQAVEIHETSMDGDVMKMQRVTDGLEVPASGEVTFEPGGYHVMLIALTQELRAGDTFPLILTFEQSDRIEVSVEVRAP